MIPVRQPPQEERLGGNVFAKAQVLFQRNMRQKCLKWVARRRGYRLVIAKPQRLCTNLVLSFKLLDRFQRLT